MAAWVATAGPPGWSLGRWTRTSETTWEEQKLGQAQPPAKFEVLLGGPETPGSTTVRLRRTGVNPEEEPVDVLILDTTVQVFQGGLYRGEYLGGWEGAVPRAAGAPIQQTFVSSGAPMASSHAQAPTMKVQTLQAASRPSSKQTPPNVDRSPAKVLALQNAVKSGDAAAVQALLDQGVDPNAQGDDGKTALLVAAAKGKLPVVEALLAAGADPNLGGKNGDTPLSVAFQQGHKAVLSKLFSSTFHSLDNMVARDPGLACATEDDDAMPPHAHENLKEVTLKLSKLSPNMATGTPSRRNSADVEDASRLDPAVMRGQALKNKMQALAANSPQH